jgi:hypothetical protein
VERVSIAFLDAYLGRLPTALESLVAPGALGRVAALVAEP